MKAITILACAMVAAVPMAAQAPTPPSRDDQQQQLREQRYRRDQVRMMEGVLSSAVRSGAEGVSRQWQSMVPNLVMFTGTARARGFMLDGYGAFFDVEIPGLRQSVVYSALTMGSGIDSALRSLQRLVESVSDAGMKRDLQASLRRIEVAVGPLPPPQGKDGMVSAATTETIGPGGMPARPADPNEQYTDSVKEALIDAMLDHGGPLGIAANEWLTVAARDAEGPLVPGQIYEAVTIFLRIRGSDLAAYVEKRLTREEARNKVEVREF